MRATIANKRASRSASSFKRTPTATKVPFAPPRPAKKSSLEVEVKAALGWLKSHSKKSTLEGMARYGIPSGNALGVTMANMKVLGKRLGRNHDLASALWKTGVYEARMVASFVAEPARLTPAQMDRWCRDFDNWAICDTVCFNLFDRSPHAFSKVGEWASRRDEFGKRGAFALLWALSVHAKGARDEAFTECLPLIERAASDERNFVKKAVNMALRAVGKRSPALNLAAVELARSLASSTPSAARWVGKDALKELTSPAVKARLAGRRLRH